MLASLLVAASLLALARAQALTINTPVPPPVSCEPTLLQWSGGTGALVNADDPSDIIIPFGELSNNSITWFVKEPVGERLLLTIRDQSGQTQNSAPFEVTGGGPNCLASSSSSGSASGSGSSTSARSTSATGSTTKATSTSTSISITTTTAASSTPATTTAPASSTKPSSAASSAPSSSASPSGPVSTSSTGGALPTGVPAAAALAALGAVAAALL
ncbi:hypothetical protein FB451DRAFT_476914 [Mycena latifolia]|nr:hypothetical protein FB451DRAFT_476914 [Mycena latifolia]